MGPSPDTAPRGLSLRGKGRLPGADPFAGVPFVVAGCRRVFSEIDRSHAVGAARGPCDETAAACFRRDRGSARFHRAPVGSSRMASILRNAHGRSNPSSATIPPARDRPGSSPCTIGCVTNPGVAAMCRSLGERWAGSPRRESRVGWRRARRGVGASRGVMLTACGVLPGDIPGRGSARCRSRSSIGPGPGDGRCTS